MVGGYSLHIQFDKTLIDGVDFVQYNTDLRGGTHTLLHSHITTLFGYLLSQRGGN